MAVSTPTTPIIARPVPATPSKLVPIEQQRRSRLRFIDGVVTVGCELLALSDKAVGALTASKAHGLQADANVDAIDTIAQRLAQRAAAMGDHTLFREMTRIRQHCAAYHVADDEEDRLRDDQAGGLLVKLLRMARGLNVALSWHLTKRGAALRKGGRG